MRFFNCSLCGHRLRFGTKRCGNCGATTPVTNQSGFWLALAVVIVVGAALVFVARRL